MKGSKIGGGSVRNCTRGKSCGATCITRPDRCNLELGPRIQESLPKVRSLIEQLDDHMQKVQEINRNFGAKDAAKWMLRNEEIGRAHV